MRRLAIRVTRRFLRWLDPSAFFNADASLVIDLLTVELESLREQLAQRQA